MGRETTATVTFRGVTAEAKLQLEGTELILRGGIKARIARSTIANVAAGPDGLTLNAAGEAVHVALPPAEAERWAKAMLKPPPSLTSKLGIGPDRPALLLGTVDDAVLAAALEGVTTSDPAAAVAIVAVLASHADLEAAEARARVARLPLWCVYAKGKAADPGDSAVRAYLRGQGMMDNKTSAVSERLTATRYARKG
jgi:hypothetical protein